MVSGVGFDFIRVLSRIPGRGMQKERPVLEAGVKQKWSYTEGIRRNRNRTDLW